MRYKYTESELTFSFFLQHLAYRPLVRCLFASISIRDGINLHQDTRKWSNRVIVTKRCKYQKLWLLEVLLCRPPAVTIDLMLFLFASDPEDDAITSIPTRTFKILIPPIHSNYASLHHHWINVLTENIAAKWLSPAASNGYRIILIHELLRARVLILFIAISSPRRSHSLPA